MIPEYAQLQCGPISGLRGNQRHLEVVHSRLPRARCVVFDARPALACVERPVTEVQRSFDPSILEGQVISVTDIQASNVTGSKQPEADLGACRT